MFCFCLTWPPSPPTTTYSGYVETPATQSDHRKQHRNRLCKGQPARTTAGCCRTAPPPPLVWPISAGTVIVCSHVSCSCPVKAELLRSFATQMWSASCPDSENFAIKFRALIVFKPKLLWARLPQKAWAALIPGTGNFTDTPYCFIMLDLRFVRYYFFSLSAQVAIMRGRKWGLCSCATSCSQKSQKGPVGERRKY